MKAEKKKGRVLRFKTGYNPNSSSIGSSIPAFLGWAAGAGILSVIILHMRKFIAAALRRKA